MSGSILEILLRTPWSIPIAIFCLSVSIFVHELGHFLVARWRGVHADRFSFFGLGKPIIGWRWKGVEWCICWIPIGAYVSIPQLADMGEIEGGTNAEATKKLPTISYLDKVLISVAGAAFNIIFALLLATVIYFTGEKVQIGTQTTTIGYVMKTMPAPDGRPGPAYVAGLQIGDVIRAIDGSPVEDWDDVRHALILGRGKSEDQQRTATFTIERNGVTQTIVVYPLLATADRIRQVGIVAHDEFVVAAVEAEKAPAKAGLKAGDRILTMNGEAPRSVFTLSELLKSNRTEPLALKVQREQATVDLKFAPGTFSDDEKDTSVKWQRATTLVHVDPFTQVLRQIKRALSLFRSLLSPSSDVGLSDMSSVVGIVVVFAAASLEGIVQLLLTTLLVNVSFAVINLMPIPVLDGGHIVFATIAKLRGKPLPLNLVATTQGVFFMLLVSAMIYVSVFDVRRVTRNQNEPTPPPAAQPVDKPDGKPAEKPAEPPARQP